MEDNFEDKKHILLKAIESSNGGDLADFEVGDLTHQDRELLAELLLKQTEENVVEGFSKFSDVFFEKIFNLTTKLMPGSGLIWCKSALLMFRLALLTDRQRFFALSMEYLEKAYRLDKSVFENQFVWWRLWGNISSSLYGITGEFLFLEKALEKYFTAETVFHKSNLEESLILDTYWDHGLALMKLGAISKEAFDISQAIHFFVKAMNNDFVNSKPSLIADYCEALATFGVLKGDSSIITTAIDIVRKAVMNTYQPGGEVDSVYSKTWSVYAKAISWRFKITLDEKHFTEADAVLKDAIMVIKNKTDLFIEWGELYLSLGVAKKDVTLIEAGLQKLTYQNVYKCDPVRISAALGEGLVVLGLLSDDLKLMNEGFNRLSGALNLIPDSSRLMAAVGFANICIGVYFQDDNYFNTAEVCFQQSLSEDCDIFQTTVSLYGIFKSNFLRGMLLKDESNIALAVEKIQILCEMRPDLIKYKIEFGLALLTQKMLIETDSNNCRDLVEKAITLFSEAWHEGGDPEALYHLGCAYDLLGDITSLEEHYQTAIQYLLQSRDKLIGRYSVLVNYTLGCAFVHYSELTQDKESLLNAVKLFELFLTMNEDDDAALCELGYAFLNLADVVKESKQHEDYFIFLNLAERNLINAVKLGNENALYHLSCLYALTSSIELSLKYLKLSHKYSSLPDIQELEDDDWLDNIKDTDDYKEFIKMVVDEELEDDDYEDDDCED